jgi:CheY-like chemotaxis protein
MRDSATGTERALFVDDEEAIVEWGLGVLTRLGYTVSASRQSREALETFKRNGFFNLVLIDQTMPEMTGFLLAVEFLRSDRTFRLLSVEAVVRASTGRPRRESASGSS